jgi:glutamate dehydrogenase
MDSPAAPADAAEAAEPSQPRSTPSLADAFAARLKAELGDGAAETAFVRQMCEEFVEDEVAGLELSELTEIAHSFWSFAQHRTDSLPKIGLAPAMGGGGRTMSLQALSIVQDDSPFLVDSVMGEVTAGGHVVKAMFHPVVEVGRDAKGTRRAAAPLRRESMILVLIEPVAEERAQALLSGTRECLADVRAAVSDFQVMRGLMRSTLEDLDANAPEPVREELPDQLDFLRWLNGNHFVFLGARIYDYPRSGSGDYTREEPRYDAAGSFGVLKDLSRSVLRRDSEPAVLSPALLKSLDETPLIVAKSNVRSRVHRRGFMDYVGVKRYGADGRPVGEVRFIGLFTADAYQESVANVPLIRRKTAKVLERADKAPGGHKEKRLKNILETYPRDELFQMSEDDLLRISLAIMHLQDRPRVRLFERRDPFDRFISIILFLPRDRYNSALDHRIREILARAWGGQVSAAYPSFSDNPLARVHYIIDVKPGGHPEPDLALLEAEVAEAARTWFDRLADALGRSGAPPEHAADLLKRYADAFPPGYRDAYGAEEALADIEVMEADSADPIKVRAYRTEDETRLQFRFKLYREGEAAPLSDVLPILENMGLKGLIESGTEVERVRSDGAASTVWVHDFLLEDERGEHLVFGEVKEPFETAFLAIWSGRTENDAFNRLVLELGIPWRETALVRALARYRQQSGQDPSQAVQTAALSRFPGIARLILDMFRIKFDPAVRADLQARRVQAEEVFAAILEALQQVESLDADRVLRRLALLVRSALRTNYYQLDAAGQPRSCISFKIASHELDDLPEPKPFREIFVWAPHVEGVHLRFGPVARGGLRWSDRREDFRTEILSLAKAQQVKNAVIVPVGAKGGFYPKSMPRGASPETVRAEGVRAYRTFLHGLLDITDNLDAKGSVISPPGVVAYDGDDPYLVVAADKGTASFSDIANDVAEDYGFWLGDAFASGGSAGYDHKAMGITARGAWEAVKRHFRELGKDIQAEPFTAAGVGDMSGDVFGNGMLLSPQIRLVAAFDHRHLFFDPTPDPAASWAERKRLFDLSGSSWADYDPKLISEGGGVFARTVKSIALTPQIKDLLDLKDDALPPTELIRAVLRARCELLYLGGIGTYVKAPGESDAEVGDKTNDPVRITAAELRCRVVGEGANLGFTQAGRIAYARAGGRIDTDAIDNSAGVDTSDHEVNIKILAGSAERAGRLKRGDRNTLLRSMTDEIAAHVLDHNYDQTLALSLQEATAVRDLDAHARFMADLVKEGRLDRQVETLPGPAAIADLKAQGRGLTRPELAVLLAYGKLELSHDIVQSSAPDDPYFFETLKGYFPEPLARFESDMKRHRLRREIISTVLANDIVNQAGPTFAPRLMEATGTDVAGLIRFFEAARRILRLDEAWAATSSQDGKIPARAQLMLYQELALILRRQTFWLARRTPHSSQTTEVLIRAYRPSADAIRAEGLKHFAPFVRSQAEERIREMVKAGAPRPLATSVSMLRPLMTISNLADMARKHRWHVLSASRIYHAVAAAFAFDRLRAAAGSLVTGGERYEQMAVRRLIEDLLRQQLEATGAVMAFAGPDQAGADAAAAKASVQSWSAMHRNETRTARQTIEEIEASPGGWSFAKLTIVNAALGALLEAAT